MVLSVFFLVVLLCILWDRFTSISVQPIETQPVYNSQQVTAEVMPSVVSLWAIKRKDLDTHISVIGCGLVVDSRGLVLTSATLTDDIESLYIIDYKDDRYQANVITTDKKGRLTLLKAGSSDTVQTNGFVAAPLADSEKVKRGDPVFVLGSRRTPSGWELTTKSGSITKQRQSLIVKKARYRNLIQTNVSLASENTSGPLVNLQGGVIGFALPFVKPENSPSSFSYAIPINQGRNFLANLPIPQWINGSADPVCSWLGAEMLEVNPVIATQFSIPDRQGEVVNLIQNNSPAEQAGLKRGDVIIDINGNKIKDRSSFYDMSLKLCQSEKTKVRILRDGEVKTLALKWNKPMYVPSGGGSLVEVVLVVLIFSLMYYFVYRNIFDRVVLFVLGAVVIAVSGHHLGFYEQEQVASALLTKLDVLCFIVGMQLITGILEEAGGLEYLARKITLATGGDRWRILWIFCIVTYLFSLVVNNLTTIMLMAPMVLRLSKYLDCDPKPFLISMIIASNLGGASTMIGDFPNMLIGTETSLPFYQFISYMLPICLLELFVLLVFLRIAKPSLFKSTTTPQPLTLDEYLDSEPLYGDFPETARYSSGTGYDPIFARMRNSLPRMITNRDALIRGLIILASVIVGFLFSDLMNWSPAIVALTGGIVALAFGGCEPFSLLEKVSIKDILFFSGLFVLVGAAEASGALSYITSVIVHFSFGNLLVLCLLLMWIGAFVTCFLNAGPTAALFLPVILSFKSAAPHSLYWWSLSLGICAGSSGTLIGATAGGVTATMVDKFIKKKQDSTAYSDEPDVDALSKSTGKDQQNLTALTFKEYASFGLPIMMIFLLISSIYITVLYRW